MELPRLSIITVCRNETARIRKTAESVVGQTCTDFEWIVIDGGSTDGTMEILNEYRNRMAHIISEPDSGVYYAMNKGARLARGEWLLFLNGGDLLAGVDVLEGILPLLGERGEDVLVGECLCTWPDGRQPRRMSHGAKLDLHHFYRTTINHQSAFIGRQVFDRFGPYDVSFRLSSDYDFFARAVLGGVMFRCVPQLVVEYDMTGMTARLKGEKDMMIELRRIRKRYPLIYRIRRLFNDSLVACRSAIVALKG
ncbi:MAG: glycosyltransferase family 2 protein [Kiritimatiellae bacterium]|nr:glycosyltransferase family 2 protein [Kiritimatiellia bacterium]MDD5522691.1 glycosyltransferase family 2 protein [Kiritimatiellia bacterium]